MNELELNVGVNKEEGQKIENELLAKKEFTEEKIEKSLNYDLLDEKEKEAIDDFVSKVDITDTTTVLSYGSNAQKEIAKFSDDVLTNVRTKNTGDVGELLRNYEDMRMRLRENEERTAEQEQKNKEQTL